MPKFNDLHIPTISMHTVTFEDGSYGVKLVVTGLDSEQKASAAMLFMQNMLCGKEIKEN